MVEIDGQKAEAIQLPPEFFKYIKERSTQKKTGGGKFFLCVLAEKEEKLLTNKQSMTKEEVLNAILTAVKDKVLDILEDAWIKSRGDSSIAKKYNVSSDTIYRLRKELEPFKDVVCLFLTSTERVKRWYIEELDQSDYETVQAYILRARRDGLKRYRENIGVAKHVWIFLKHRTPENWTADDVISFLNTKTKGAQSRYLDCIRQIAPQIASKTSVNAIKTGRFREKLMRRKKDIFGQDIKMIKDALEEYNDEVATKWMFHLTLGSREGGSDSTSGLTGISFDRFHRDFTLVDLYESKVRGGIWWRDCPVDLFFPHLPEKIKKLWIKRGRPTEEKLFLGGYKEITDMYKNIRKLLSEKFKGKIEPSLLKEFENLKPHDADKIHVNLLWEAEVPLEVVGGQDLGGSEGVGLMGRGWLDVNVIKKYYLSMTARSKRFTKVRALVTDYSKQFNGGSPDDKT